MEAYEYYLRALEFMDKKSGPEAAQKLVELLELAVETDPRFAVAWALLAEAYVWAYWIMLNPVEGLEIAAQAVKTATRIDSDLPEIDMALGYIEYYGHRKFEKAAVHFSTALEKQPNDMKAIRALGLVRRRQGRWEESLALFERAARINPRDFSIFYDGLGHILMYLHRFDEAERYTDRAIEMEPEVIVPYYVKTLIVINKTGDVEEARKILDRMFSIARPGDKCILFQYMETGPLPRICYSDLCEFITQLDIENCAIPGNFGSAYRAGLWYLCEDDNAAMEETLLFADSASAELSADTTGNLLFTARAHIVLGKLYARLGHKDDALREGHRAVQILPISDDAIDGPDILFELADIYMIIGDHEAAIDILETILSVPCNYTMRMIDLDPLYEPVRDHPRYRKLTGKYPYLESRGRSRMIRGSGRPGRSEARHPMPVHCGADSCDRARRRSARPSERRCSSSPGRSSLSSGSFRYPDRLQRSQPTGCRSRNGPIRGRRDRTPAH